MSAKITLTITRADDAGEVFVITERATCVLGRAGDCSLRVPYVRNPMLVSRHHCLIDINPPDVRLRDLGSRNGTHLNGRLIGQRKPNETPEEAARTVFPEFDLKEGDEIRLVDTVIRIGITVPALCATCSAEVPDDDRDRAAWGPGLFQCAACRNSTLLPSHESPPVWRPRACPSCGRDLTVGAAVRRAGEALCSACRSAPEALARDLFDRAQSGEPELQVLHGYRFVRGLGGGGMGAVYLIQHDRTGELRALKLMLPKVAVEEEHRQRFERELRLIQALDHPHIVRAFDSGRAHGFYFYTMEYCPGGSVDRLLGHPGATLPVAEAVALTFQTLDGLNYVHNAILPDGRQGIVHRDLKPENIVLAGPDGARIAKIADFGLSKAFDAAGMSGLTRSADIMGTPRFMARQQVVSFKYASPEVDVWAAAATLYFLLSGVAPRPFPKGMDWWVAVLEEDPVPIRALMPSIPHRLANVIDLALTEEPRITFSTAIELKRALEEAL